MTPPTTAEVRAWARDQGYTVADRGRLSAEVVAAYAAAHPSEGDAHDGGGAQDPGRDPDLREAPDGADAPDAVAADAVAPDAVAADAVSDSDPSDAVAPPVHDAADAPPPSTRTDAVATAAVLASAVPFLALVGIGLGIAALVRTRRSGRPGRDLALAGIAVGATWLLALVALVVVAFTVGTGTVERDEVGRGVVASADVVLDDLEPGDCVRRVPEGAVRTVRAVPCDVPHRAEVVAVFDLPGTAYPGDLLVRAMTDTGCDRRAAALGLPTEGLVAVSFSPDAQTWRLGDREAICLLEAAEPRTAPLSRGTGT